MITRLKSRKLVALAYTNCSDEDLEYVFTHIGYQHQQKLVRVCRRWMAIITNRLDHIYVSLHMFKEFLITVKHDQKLRSNTIRLKEATWKYQCKAVRRLTYDGNYSTLLGMPCRTIDLLAKQYPCLSELNIIRVTAARPLREQIRKLENTMTLEDMQANWPSLKIVLRSHFVTALPHKLTRVYRPQRLTQLIQTHFGRLYLRIPDMVLGDYDDYLRAVDAAIWPFPVEQTRWLACHVPKLNHEEFGMQEIIRVISSQDILRDKCGYVKAANRPCEEHAKFCDHLDAGYYENTLDGHSKLILALCLYHMIIPGVGHPPFPFVFYQIEWPTSTSTMVAPLSWM